MPEFVTPTHPRDLFVAGTVRVECRVSSPELVCPGSYLEYTVCGPIAPVLSCPPWSRILGSGNVPFSAEWNTREESNGFYIVYCTLWTPEPRTQTVAGVSVTIRN
jgi:hypothetical protein